MAPGARWLGALDQAAAEILKLGVDVQVLAPPALRRRRAGFAARLGAFYRAEKP
jgi:hypothetical protein